MSEPGIRRSRQGSSRIAAYAGELGPSDQAGMIAGSNPTGAGACLKRSQTRARVASSKAQLARHSALQVSCDGAQ
jgi:hypothetical protein